MPATGIKKLFRRRRMADSDKSVGDRASEVVDYVKSYLFGDKGDDDDAGDSLDSNEVDDEYKGHPASKYTGKLELDPPSSFKPLPVKNQEPPPKASYPTGPPKPFKSPKVLEVVDTHAVEVAGLKQEDFRQLVWQLIYARDITNELEKSRAVFTWCCSKDVTTLDFEDAKSGSPEETLMNWRRGTTTVAIVFDILCSYGGIHSQVIRGFAKGSDYTPGMKFSAGDGRHSWNAAHVNGQWRLIDCHWASRRLVGKKVTTENLHQEMDEYYYMPDPRQLIFTHLPDESEWQLLKRTLSKDAFENSVALKPGFFKHGLRIVSHKGAVVPVKKDVAIRIGCPKSRAHQIGFTFSLVTEDGKENYEGQKLTQFGMHEKLGNVGFFSIRPPQKGKYRLVIFAKEGDERVYGGVTEYELNCEQVYDSARPFPACAHTTWGEGDSYSKFELMPYRLGAIVNTRHGSTEIKLKLNKELRFSAKLKSSDLQEKDLQCYIMERVVGDVAYFTVRAPREGEFGLEIFANDPDRDGNSLLHIYQYLIVAKDVDDTVEALPVLPPSYLGPQPMFKQLGISTHSHDDPYIQSHDGDSTVTFKMNKPTRMSAQLLFCSGGRNDDFTEYVLQQGDGDEVTFVIEVPRQGFYRLQIFGLPKDDTRETLPGVFNYLLDYRRASKKAVPFPLQYGVWKQGCHLYKPFQRDLKKDDHGKKVDFRLKVPGAEKVAVVVGETWTQLTQRSSGAWDADVDLSDKYGKDQKLTVCAKFTGGKDTFSTLLQYSVA